jgi:ATP-dependent DNA helicase RecG
VKDRIFLSSVQKELAAERQALRDYIRSDKLLGQYFEVFLFEDLPASDREAGEVFLAEVERAAIYIGLFGADYGFEDAKGVSPTEREFDRATERGRKRLIFVKDVNGARHPKMQTLIAKASAQLIRRKFIDEVDLKGKLYDSLLEYLQEQGSLSHLPFMDAAPAATMADISPSAIEQFVRRARAERKFPLEPAASPRDVLTHLALVDGERPTRAAILLFGQRPEKFLPSAEIKCLHYHGTRQEKPIPSYQVFKGSLFEQIDAAVDFVMARLRRSVAPRSGGARADVGYEMPREVIAEAIVNAAAHRDYRSNASVQVYVFADRIEVRNPGELPPSLTPEALRVTHSSVPRNVRLAEVLWFAHYIEKVGTGTLDLIAGCQSADLPEPDFRQSGDEFLVTLWRDWLTEEVLAGLALNTRQHAAIAVVKSARRIDNMAYRQLFGVTKPTATRDLEELVTKGLLRKVGRTGKGTHYVLRPNGLMKGSKGSRLGANEDDALLQTRRKPAKPATGKVPKTTGQKRAKRAAGSVATRQKPDKPDVQKGKRLTKGSKGSAARTKRKGSRQ